MGIMARSAVLAVLLLPACSYEPPVRADRSAPKVRADLDICNDEAARDAGKVTGATLWSFLKSPFTYPPLKHEKQRACMVRRGYTLEAPDT